MNKVATGAVSLGLIWRVHCDRLLFAAAVGLSLGACGLVLPG